MQVHLWNTEVKSCIKVIVDVKVKVIACLCMLWWRRGAVVERRTGDKEVVGSSLGRAHGVKILGKFLTPMCLCHQAV